MSKTMIMTVNGLRIIIQESQPDVFLAKALIKDEEMYFGTGTTMEEAMKMAKENILSLQEILS